MNEHVDFKPEDVLSVGTIENKGSVVARDLLLVLSRKLYLLSVCTQEYMDRLKRYNRRFPEGLRLDENFLVVPGFSDLNNLDVVSQRLGQMELILVKPYLVEQEREVEEWV